MRNDEDGRDMHVGICSPKVPEEFVFRWDASAGGLHLSKTTGMTEECSSVHPGSDGFACCEWAEEVRWESDIPNLMIES